MSINELITSLELGLIYGIAAIGIYLTFRVIDFADLTCDGSFVLGAAVSAMLLKANFHPLIALLGAAMAGGCAGIATGILNIYFKMSNLLAGILVAYMLYSVNLKVMHGVPNIALINIATILDNHQLAILIAIAVLIWLIIGFILSSDFGLALRSLGQNKRLALNCGINLTSMTFYGLIASNALIGISGGLFSQHQGFADVSQGLGTVIIGFASVMIGEKLLPYRSIWVAIIACLLGSIVYRIILALALHSEWLGLATQDLNLITGILVVVIMCLPPVKITRSRKAC
jgi:putative ABC transport system permease protein